MTLRRVAVVTTGLLLVITGCGSSATGSGACEEGAVGECQDNGLVVAEDDSTPSSASVHLVATSPVDSAMEALIAGVVDMVDGCLGLRHDDGSTTVVSWHRGSELVDDPAGVRLPSGRELGVGQHLEAGGGLVDAGADEVQACPGAEQVWMLGDVVSSG